ncbi:MAG: protein kinase [Deltaproteobacteria bacterium]|nr:protein kinase [Deltaproteobacteria bacterium]MBW2078314.1 protein kinase [Deltaproteobacteria bacterium]
MPDIPETIDRYEIIKKIGQGSRGIVYLGRDPYIDRQVAIKTYRVPQHKGPKVVKRYQKRFFVEAQSAGLLMHPNIVAVYDADMADDFCYITMEYVDGHTLERFCYPDNLLPVDRVAETIFSVCQGLEYAHQQGVIHRDIKPPNIILSSSGKPKITDFSIAFMKRGSSTLEQGLFGSPSYMSPEQVKEDPITEQTDLFSLGAILYELLTGKKAFEGNNDYSVMFKIVTEDPPPIFEMRPELPPILGEILTKALAKETADRYKNSMEFAYDLRLAIRDLKETPRETHDKELINYIHTLPFFSNFTEAQIDEILSASNLNKVEGGKTIIEEGEIDDSFYILISGDVLVRKGDRDVAVLEKGQCFGEMAYLTGEARTASIIARSDCILLKFSATLLEKLSESIQLLFFKNFTTTILERLSKGR